ncbi:MAG: glycosyltransferase family 4 protein [Gammaproteobacteria bacterium]
MRILILSFYYPPDLSAGSFRTQGLVKALEEKMSPNGEIEVVTSLPNRYHSLSTDADEVEENGAVRIKRIPVPSHRSGLIDQSVAFGVFALKAFSYARRGNYDLVYATSSRLFTAFLGAVIARRSNIPLYLDIRDIFVDTIQEVLPRSLGLGLLPTLRAIERYTIKAAARVNLVSEGFRQYFRSGYPNQTFSFFPNGIDEEFLGVDFTKAETNKTPIVLYAGNIGKGQGLDKIVPELASKSMEHEFWIVGDGGAKQPLEKGLRKKGAENVRLSTPINRSRLIQLYADADYLFLHLNDYQAFRRVLPSKIFEYAATGKPILAGVDGYAADFLRENVDNVAVFPPCDASAAVDAIQTLSERHTPRPKFISRFERKLVMRGLAADLLMLQLRN